MNIIFAIFFGFLRTPALIYFAITGFTVYVITFVLGLVFVPLRFFSKNFSGPAQFCFGLLGILVLYNGFYLVKDLTLPILETNSLVTVPTMLLTYESLSNNLLDGFYITAESIPSADSLFDWTKAYLGEYDIHTLLIAWWVLLASEFGPLIYYGANRFFSVIGMVCKRNKVSY